MPRRHPLPTPWLISDARLTTGITALAALLPPGGGIVLRHDDLAAGPRWRLLRRLIRIARARRLIILIADTPARARRWGADGVHLRQHLAAQGARARQLGLILSMPVHDRREAARARRAGADIALVSPLHPTRSHPGAAALGPAAWLRLARQTGAAPVALGGMNPARARVLRRQARAAAIGWAAIDAWDERAKKRRGARQKRNAVPT